MLCLSVDAFGTVLIVGLCRDKSAHIESLSTRAGIQLDAENLCVVLSSLA